MNCLCCGKPLSDHSSSIEKESLWHTRCVKRFFGTKTLPEIDLSEKALYRLAWEGINNGLTVPGVQKKMSLHLSSSEKNEDPRLTMVDYPTGYILKPQTKDFPSLPEAEYLIMQMAQKVGIKTVPFALIRMQDQYAYITKRIDRPKENIMLAMEDFCQLDGRLTADKYKGSYERCGKIILEHSAFPGLDLSEFFIRIVFSFLVGNSDMHLKNFSLIETAEGSGQYHLSPAYDLLPVNIVMPADTEETALTLCGKKRRLKGKHFVTFAEQYHISHQSSRKMIKNILSKKQDLLKMCQESFMSDSMKEALEELIQIRASALSEIEP